MILEYFAASFGAFLIIFIEFFNQYSAYTHRAIFNWWGGVFLALNALAGAGTYFIFDTGILQADIKSSQNLNRLLVAFMTGMAFQTVIRSQLTLFRFNKPESIEKIDVSTPWDKWYETFREFFYDKITIKVKPYVIKDVDLGSLKAKQLIDNCSVKILKDYLANFIDNCEAPRIRNTVENQYKTILKISSDKEEEWLHKRLATLVLDHISDDKLKELTNQEKKLT
jgi:hypothetical protein